MIPRVLATQIGFQIGLHRPTLAVELDLGKCNAYTDSETKRTTSLACYVVSHMQASRPRLPVTFPEDFTLLTSFNDPSEAPSFLDSAVSTGCRAKWQPPLGPVPRACPVSWIP
jgi:hypothetical protein